MIAAAEEIPAALHDHWEDVTAAIHEADARRLYVDVAEPLQERAALSLGADAGAGALVPGPAGRVPVADARRGRGASSRS